MGKTTKVKWAIGADEPEDLQEFLSNDDIEEKHGRPPRGNYTLQVKRVTVRDIKSGDNKGSDRLNLMLTINEPAKSDKAVFNSYLVWDGMNVTEQGKPFIKRWLKSLGLEWNDFYSKSKQDDQDPPHITQIGGIKFESDKVVNLRATLKSRTNNNTGEPEIVVGRYLPPADEDDDDDDEGEEEETTTLGEDEDEDDEATDESEESEDDADEDEDEWTREDLEDEDLDDIKQVAKDDFGLKVKDIKGKDKEALLDLLFPPEDDDDEEDEDEDDDEDEPDEDEVEELTEELNGLKIAGLRKRALRNDKEADLDGLKKKDLVHLILEQELNVPPF